MVPISMARYEQIWLNSLHAMSSVKVSATQDGQRALRPASLSNITHYMDPYEYQKTKSIQKKRNPEIERERKKKRK